MNLFITGTDTNVGKTYVAAALVREARSRGLDAIGWKPICCGDRADAEALHAASGGAATLAEVNPVWLRAPAAPYAAALIENRQVDLALIRDVAAEIRSRHASIIAEGAGGWAVPILRDYWMRDLARELGWPVLLVAANRLGALNHTLLTLEAIRAAGLRCLGLVLNHPVAGAAGDPATVTNAGVLETLTDVKIWEVGHGKPLGGVCSVLEQL